MTKKRIFKILTAILVALSIFIFLSQVSFALPFNIDEQFEGKVDKGNATNTLAGIFGQVINVFQIIATGIAILMIVVIAIKWLYASPSGKVQMAKTFRYYILGAIFIFAAVTLLQIIKTFAVNNI